jgi:hypothetical protein
MEVVNVLQAMTRLKHLFDSHAAAAQAALRSRLILEAFEVSVERGFLFYDR